MDPMITSTLIETGANLLGGLFGGKGQSNKSMEQQARAAEERAFDNTIRMAQKYPSAAMKGWKDAGIHPLAGLGMSMGSAPQTSFGGGSDSGGSRWGEALSTMGQGVSRAVAAYASREEREMAKMSAKLQLENQGLQNDRLRSEIALMHGTGSPPALADAGFVTGDQDARYPEQARMPVGFGDTKPMFRKAVDTKGNTMDVYNDELGDNEVLQALTAFGYTIPQWMVNQLGNAYNEYDYQISKIPHAVRRWFARHRRKN